MLLICYRNIIYLILIMNIIFNPIPRGLKYNLFHAGRGIYAPPRDFALAEPMMNQKLCHFIHIKFEQFVGHRKRKQHFKSKNVVVAAKKNFVA